MRSQIVGQNFSVSSARNRSLNRTGGLPWQAFFEAAGVPDIEEINVMTPSFFAGLDELGQSLSLNVAKHYLRFQVLDSAASFLSKPFVDANFELYSKQLGGVPEQEPRCRTQEVRFAKSSSCVPVLKTLSV